MKMKAMIFAAGLGTRLKPITDTLPKALVPVCGKPLIEHVCRKLHEAGIDEAVVNVHHFAEKIGQWLSAQDWISFRECVGSGTQAKEGAEMTVQVSDERAQLLETGGAVLHARRYLEGCGSFLIHNVDILSDLDIRWFASQVRPEALATLLVSDRPSSRQLLFDPSSMRLVGWRNNVTGQVRSPFSDLNPDDCLALAFSGIHIMSDSIFDPMQDYAVSHGLCLTDNPPRFPVIDFYLWACARHDIYGICADSLELIDVGKLDSLEAAEKLWWSAKC